MAKVEGTEHPPKEKPASCGSVAALAWEAAVKGPRVRAGMGVCEPCALEESTRRTARSLCKWPPRSTAGRGRDDKGTVSFYLVHLSVA